MCLVVYKIFDGYFGIDKMEMRKVSTMKFCSCRLWAARRRRRRNSKLKMTSPTVKACVANEPKTIEYNNVFCFFFSGNIKVVRLAATAARSTFIIDSGIEQNKKNARDTWINNVNEGDDGNLSHRFRVCFFGTIKHGLGCRLVAALSFSLCLSIVKAECAFV